MPKSLETNVGKATHPDQEGWAGKDMFASTTAWHELRKSSKLARYMDPSTATPRSAKGCARTRHYDIDITARRHEDRVQFVGTAEAKCWKNPFKTEEEGIGNPKGDG
ncbi:uncharacterized protein EKO05_0009501 [Ascochyta rabiei]|nr:uncharacterized protein EKO05_0009501 [Ascochyta rabiei]UPX19232.1 hypothetical protein EKO05_0009501 [Ascochyta rabiei]